MQTVTLLARLLLYCPNKFSAYYLSNTLLISSLLITPCVISSHLISSQPNRLDLMIFDCYVQTVSCFFGLISYLTQNTSYLHYKKTM